MGKYKCGKIYKLTVSELKINADQPRKLMEENEFQKLVDSIQKKGLIHPIVVKELEDGTISIVSGSRRYKAHKLLNLKKIPAWFTDGDPAELGLVENLIREDLSQMEVAEALQKLKDNSVNKTQVDLAKLIGKAESTVSEILSLNKLPQDIRDEIRADNRYAVRELKKIASKRKIDTQRILFNKYKNKISGTAVNSKTQGPELHRKKIVEMEKYFMSMRERYKLALLPTVREEIISLKSSIETILNDLQELYPIFDASNVIIRNKSSDVERTKTEQEQSKINAQ